MLNNTLKNREKPEIFFRFLLSFHCQIYLIFTLDMIHDLFSVNINNNYVVFLVYKYIVCLYVYTQHYFHLANKKRKLKIIWRRALLIKYGSFYPIKAYFMRACKVYTDFVIRKSSSV